MFNRSSRKKIVLTHQQLYKKGFGVGNDGNTSIKINKKHMLITPTGFQKDQLKRQDLSLICLVTGKHLRGPTPSSEYQLHLACYQHNPSFKAVVHSHPPYAIACSLAHIGFEEPVLPEVVIALGNVPTCPYTTPGTLEIAQQAAQALHANPCIILERHGVVSASKHSIEEAFTQLERVEHTAKILWLSHCIQKPTLLTDIQHQELLDIRENSLAKI